MVVDHDGAARVERHADRVQIEAPRVRRPTGGHQKFIGPHLAVIGDQREFVVRERHGGGLCVRQHRDALGAEGLRDGLPDGRIFANEQRAAGQDGDVAAESRERLGELHRDDGRPDDREPRRNAVAREGLGRCPVRRLLQTRNRRYCGARPRGDQATVERNQTLSALGQRHGERVAVRETRLAAHDRDGRHPGEDPLVLGVAQFLDAALLLREQARPVDDRRHGREARIERALAAHVGDMGRTDQDLGRHTADVDAGTPDDAALDERDRRATFSRLQRRRHRPAATADDGDAPRGTSGRRACFRRHAVTGGLHGGGEQPKIECRGAAHASRPLRIGDLRRLDARHAQERLADVAGTAVAGHARDVELVGVHFPFMVEG